MRAVKNIKNVKNVKNIKDEVVRNLILLFFVFIFAFPLYFLVRTSFDGKGIGNYINALMEINLGRHLKNSAVVTASTVLLVCLISIPAAFAFSKMRFPLKKSLFLLILITMMIPGISIVVPLVKIIKGLDLLNNYLSLILVYTALNAPISLILSRSFMDQLPAELMEASFIDGCNIFRTFFNIFLPLAKPIIGVIVVLTSLASWNEFLFAKIFMSKEAMEMVTTIPIKFQNNFYTDIPGLFAALVLIQLPIILLYLIFQRLLMEGLTAGAVKG